MPPAVIAGGIAAAGAIGGAVIGSKSQKSAAKSANASQQQATQAQLQLGRETMALNKDIYNSNFNTLSPFVSRGNVAGDSINALLGLGTAPAMQSPLAGGAAPAAQSQGFGARIVNEPSSGSLSQLIAQRMGGQRNPVAGQEPLAQTTPAATPTSTPMSAMEQFANSAGMQFQLDQGADMINNRYAGAGALQSGAAMKALQDYGQQTAVQNYFMPYMGLLGGQQAVGAGAASSIAGVGQNFGNTAANINAGMGANIQNGANAASNAALLKGQANANMWTGIGGALGGLASSFVK